MIYLIPTIFFVYGYLYYRKIVRFIEMPFMEQAPCFLKKKTHNQSNTNALTEHKAQCFCAKVSMGQ